MCAVTDLICFHNNIGLTKIYIQQKTQTYRKTKMPSSYGFTQNPAANARAATIYRLNVGLKVLNRIHYSAKTYLSSACRSLDVKQFRVSSNGIIYHAGWSARMGARVFLVMRIVWGREKTLMQSTGQPRTGNTSTYGATIKYTYAQRNQRS